MSAAIVFMLEEPMQAVDWSKEFPFENRGRNFGRAAQPPYSDDAGAGMSKDGDERMGGEGAEEEWEEEYVTTTDEDASDPEWECPPER